MLQLFQPTTSRFLQYLFYSVKDGSVSVLNLAVGLWVGYGRPGIIDSEFLKEFLEGEAIKLPAIVNNNLYRCFEPGNDVSPHKPLALLGCNSRELLSFYPFCEIIDSHDYKLTPSGSHQEGAYQVYSPSCERNDIVDGLVIGRRPSGSFCEHLANLAISDFRIAVDHHAGPVVPQEQDPATHSISSLMSKARPFMDFIHDRLCFLTVDTF